jgi:hypothetical protein
MTIQLGSFIFFTDTGPVGTQALGQGYASTRATVAVGREHALEGCERVAKRLEHWVYVEVAKV